MMIEYNISYKKPWRHFIDFELKFETNGCEKIILKLASWRPGRYELANYAQYIQKWSAFSINGKRLKFKKIDKDSWLIECNGLEKVKVKYNFYANLLNAGSSFLDENQLYINPVNCIFYLENRIDEKYKLTLDIPSNYKIATSLSKKGNTLYSENFDSLAESPIICSKNLQHNSYEVDNILFHLWFEGSCKPNWKKLISDFKRFTQSQINHFGDFPVDEYHFLFQITPYRSYHGVEHTKNTVLLLGPSDDLMTERYDDLLGVCSHELYHTWNIKSIRPIEMLPYDYSKENYFRTGYVAEGVTTYMGDLFLINSKVFSWDDFIKTQNQNLYRHLMNYGRFNLSVADSGFDSWLDGYKMGTPDRKVSIYPDGALCMLMIDLNIIKNSDTKHSLHCVMKDLYTKYAKKEIGYSEDDFKSLCTKYGGNEVSKIFQNHIYGTSDYIPSLKKSIEIVGLKLVEKKNPDLLCRYFGIVSQISNNKLIIKKVEPNSTADQNGIGPEDIIIEINNNKNVKDYKEILTKSDNLVSMKIEKKLALKYVELEKGNYFKLLEFKKEYNISDNQSKCQKKWLS